MPSDPLWVAEMFDLAATEPSVLQQLKVAVSNLEAVQGAKVALARLQPAELQAELLRRRTGASR